MTTKHSCFSGLAVTSSPKGPGDIGIKSHFLISGYAIDLKNGIVVAPLLDSWQDWVFAGSGWPGVSILCLGGMASLI